MQMRPLVRKSTWLSNNNTNNNNDLFFNNMFDNSRRSWLYYHFRPYNRPFFLSRFSLFSAFWGFSRFGHSKQFFFVFPATNMSEPRSYLCVQSPEFLFVYLVAVWGKYTRVLLYLVRKSSNKQHRSEHVFTMARISAGLVRANIVNETA